MSGSVKTFCNKSLYIQMLHNQEYFCDKVNSKSLSKIIHYSGELISVTKLDRVLAHHSECLTVTAISGSLYYVVSLSHNVLEK